MTGEKRAIEANNLEGIDYWEHHGYERLEASTEGMGNDEAFLHGTYYPHPNAPEGTGTDEAFFHGTENGDYFESTYTITKYDNGYGIYEELWWQDLYKVKDSLEMLKKEVELNGRLELYSMQPKDHSDVRKMMVIQKALWTTGVTGEWDEGTLNAIENLLVANRVDDREIDAHYVDMKILELLTKRVDEKISYYAKNPDKKRSHDMWERSGLGELLYNTVIYGAIGYGEYERGRLDGKTLSQEEIKAEIAYEDEKFMRNEAYDDLAEGKIKVKSETAEGVENSIEINNVEIVDSKGVPLGELDGLDLQNGIIYEDKAVKGLDIINPKTGMPQQTAEQWADKQIYKKTKTRIINLNEAVGTKMPGDVTIPEGVKIPTINQIKDVKKFVFRLEGDSPELRKAMEGVIDKLSKEFPDYKFDVDYIK